MRRKQIKLVLRAANSDQQRALFALLGALGLHVMLLMSSSWLVSVNNSVRYSHNPISVQLEQRIQQAMMPEPEASIPVVGAEREPEVKPQPEVSQENSSRYSSAERPTPISTATLEKWSKLETEQLLSANPAALTEFSTTFAEPTVAKRVQQESFQDAYGDTRIVTQVGDKQVCYMQGSQHPQDDWAKSLVMFYSCPSREKFTLEIP